MHIPLFVMTDEKSFISSFSFLFGL